MNILYEIIGYIGTALILLSMMMTSVKKLRIFNLCGCIFSVAYALLTHAMPVLLLNFSLAMIQVVQLYRLRNQKEETK